MAKHQPMAETEMAASNRKMAKWRYRRKTIGHQTKKSMKYGGNICEKRMAKSRNKAIRENESGESINGRHGENVGEISKLAAHGNMAYLMANVEENEAKISINEIREEINETKMASGDENRRK
jgi:ATP-dependent helicase/DNAse subunit B